MRDEDRLSDEAEARIAEDRRRCAERNAEHEPQFSFIFTERQVEDLASGYVPSSVKAMMRAGLDWYEDMERAAARPTDAERKEARQARKRKATAA